MTRRQAVAQFLQFLAASPLLRADHKHSELGDPVLAPANVFDFAKLAKAKLDPLAWDYMDEGSEDEATLHDNRGAFNNIIIRPHFLLHDEGARHESDRLKIFLFCGSYPSVVIR